MARLPDGGCRVKVATLGDRVLQGENVMGSAGPHVSITRRVKKYNLLQQFHLQDGTGFEKDCFVRVDLRPRGLGLVRLSVGMNAPHISFCPSQ